MPAASLTIDLDAIAANWAALDAMTSAETGACVKADGYGLGADPVARALWQAGCRRFFVALASEGAALRDSLPGDAEINVFGGHMAGDTDLIRDHGLVPMLNSLDQITRHLETLRGHPFGIQLDTGMNRLGLEIDDWAAVAEIVLAERPTLLMSHLACADEPDHPMNARQRETFDLMTAGFGVPRSLAATGGILLGPDYHYDLTRPGIGLYGGMPFAEARPVVRLEIPVIQARQLAEGETVGYGNSWTAKRPSVIATVAAGYADGLSRHLSSNAELFAPDGTSVPLVGRVSMDLITVDVTDLPEVPGTLTILSETQTVDALAERAGTIGYEVLTSMGARYRRDYRGG